MQKELADAPMMFHGHHPVACQWALKAAAELGINFVYFGDGRLQPTDGAITSDDLDRSDMLVLW